MNKQEIFINFGGFYNSIHDAQIENQFEAYEDNIDIETNKQDWTKTQINYSQAYLKKMEQFLFNEKIEAKFKFIRIESPGEYNFRTDQIVVNILKKHQKSIINFVKNNFSIELVELIKKQTTPASGYRPFYTFNEIYKENINDLLLEACLEIICDEVNKDELPYEFDLEYIK
ncbi:hypothetical protein UFOVP831_42 [uncultured Caudovirales phage]|uniref:Uncharacterized protein n=1 Tax=uncultured Caudovirales phage TaxID=2100421 RepID=A0A6J5P3E2_9CAUD|nr:hypothetical protein UFOVP831_42 [uncultured Caudovirales phage]